jgi:hypothetical protein
VVQKKSTARVEVRTQKGGMRETGNEMKKRREEKRVVSSMKDRSD